MLDYLHLNTKTGYNNTIRHFKIVAKILESADDFVNVADLINQRLEDGLISIEQIMPIINIVLVENYNYKFSSFRTSEKLGIDELYQIQKLASNLKKFDMVVVYFHPSIGTTVINPKNKAHWDNIHEISRKELMIVYLQAINEADSSLEEEAIFNLKMLLNKKYGESSDLDEYFSEEKKRKDKSEPIVTKIEEVVLSSPGVIKGYGSNKSSGSENVTKTDDAGSSKPKIPERNDGYFNDSNTIAATRNANSNNSKPSKPAEKQKSQQQGGKSSKKENVTTNVKKMTPKYSCQVTNELFHNGNVEAWKNIIESYQAKFPHLEVYVYHDGQRVQNLNSLFKWGKVKHGDVILFSVVGENFQSISKLQKYLFEGASNRFEIFLKKEPGIPLSLF